MGWCEAAGMLYAIPIWAIAFALVVGICICGEIGFHVGARLKAHLSDGPFSGLQAAFFGLLALLLAFSFSLGLSRYDARRHASTNRSQLHRYDVPSYATAGCQVGGADARLPAALRRDSNFLRVLHGRCSSTGGRRFASPKRCNPPCGTSPRSKQRGTRTLPWCRFLSRA